MAAGSALLVGLVEEFVSGQQDSKAADTATGLKAGQFTILQLVEALGLHLASSQPQTRARGVQLLSNVLQQCHGDLTEREVEVLLAFYENRLKDHYVITPHVLKGLNALTKCSVLPPGSAVSILKSLFQDVHVQSLMLVERSCVYNILTQLMESRESELKGLGADFVFGFVQSVDGERDPRNLLLAFQIARKIIHGGYDLGKFTEELFEVTSCYFPIDFSPPPNDPHGITQEELILALRAVLTGTPRFAEFLLPLIIEKLDSDVQSAKVDSLQTLTACASVYEHKELAEFLPGLWASLRREVFQTASERVESAGLAALGALTACISRSVLNSDSEDYLNVFLDLVLKDCQHHLCEPDLKLVWPSAKLLQATSTASYRASHRVAAAIMPSLIEQYNSRTQCAQRRTLLEMLQGFVQPVKSSEEDESVLLDFRQSLCSIVFSALSENSAGLQITSLRVLTALSQHTVLLLESDVELAVEHLTRLILEEEDAKVSLAVVECAGALACLHPLAFISKMVPRLKEEIFSESMAQGDSAPLSQEHPQQAVRQRCLTALAAVSSRPSVVQESTPVLLQVLTSSHTGTGSFSLEEVISVCHNLQRIAEHAQDTEETGRVFHDIVIPRLLGLALQAAMQGSSDHQSPLVEESVLSAMVPVISTTCARLQSQLAGQTASRAVSLFLDGDMSFLPENAFPSKIQLLKQVGDSWSQSQMVCLLMGCVCSLPRSVEVPQMDRLLLELEELSCTCDHPLSYTSAAKCYAGLVNKRPAGEALDSLIDRMLKRISTELDCASSSVRTQAFTLLLWVAKALLLRYHPLSTALTDKLFSLLSDSELGLLAADGFSLLMSDSPDVLNRGCNADIRIMYRQRFFTENSAKLVLGFNSAAQERKSGYLKALSHIVNNLPRQVQLTELPALLPLLLEALSCPDQAVQLSTLSCLQPVLMDPPSALITQLEALVGRTLTLTTSPAMKVRIASLRCIHALSRFPEHEIMPFRARVLRALAVPLDDLKRMVRSEAVVARNEWFLLGSPGGR
ncbi:MMS19 nucleotide excision repair protein homolog isoform X2 [Salmo salar]|uniref:MMS19 nucleotide excision repair protein n=1 Tax=Salmo salar TaxID=8030 RepID=A0A1S3NEI5_SALSA|nr:MMS19 nucleotide excision repair protein homolog isoform X2 [Salmo salar]|eukprot:XP_014013849.1 PREDICTED: MMS19 nucleotide excision repair protein homolog isoform X2 [Salmo salar]